MIQNNALENAQTLYFFLIMICVVRMQKLSSLTFCVSEKSFVS